MTIRNTRPEELDELEIIYANARRFMAENGNPHQWGDEQYPSRALLEEDVRLGQSFVCVEGDEILATYCLTRGPEGYYTPIYEGAWLDDADYVVVHRIANAGKKAGAGQFCLRHVLEHYGNLRIDTHPDNLPMQGLLNRMGFALCGTLYYTDGTPRLAYQKTGL